MINIDSIQPGLPIVCSDNREFARVDHMEGGSQIKLERDKAGNHHYIPLSWVTKVDEKVHIDRSRSQAIRDWSATPSMMS